jgi:hypothetical protein
MNSDALSYVIINPVGLPAFYLAAAETDLHMGSVAVGFGTALPAAAEGHSLGRFD